MAKSKPKAKPPVRKKAAVVAAKPAAKAKPKAAAPVKKAAKPVAKAAQKVVAKKPAAAKKAAKPVAKPAPKAAAKPAAKAAPKAPAKPVAPSKPVAVPKPAPAAKAPSKRPVAVSHRPQKAAAVAVQPRPAAPKPTPSPSRNKLMVATGAGGTLTEDDLRRAPDSAYMNDEQLGFFNDRLMQMRSEVLAREVDVKERLHQREVFADPADRASAEEEHWLDLRLRERESLLLKKIDDALRRIRDKEYGYCEKTGEPIGIARLLARPTATVCVDIKGQDERAESQYRDR
jgi:DnaK suppressor protein